MATLTITDAARVTGVSRTLLYRYIKSDKLSRTPEGLIDTVELLRAGLRLQTSDVTIPVAPLHDVTPYRLSHLIHAAANLASFLQGKHPQSLCSHALPRVR